MIDIAIDLAGESATSEQIAMPRCSCALLVANHHPNYMTAVTALLEGLGFRPSYPFLSLSPNDAWTAAFAEASADCASASDAQRSVDWSKRISI
ncbi:hypothetical protein [Bradyrhizobium cenepequi]|jgi:hypothetical protein